MEEKVNLMADDKNYINARMAWEKNLRLLWTSSYLHLTRLSRNFFLYMSDCGSPHKRITVWVIWALGQNHTFSIWGVTDITLYKVQVCNITIQCLYILLNDHHNVSGYYLSPCILNRFFFTCDENFYCLISQQILNMECMQYY